MDSNLNGNEEPKKLSTLESFLQFDASKLDEKQKDLHSIIALVISAIWLVLSFFGILLGILFMIIVSGILFKIIKIGINSKKKWLSIIAIVLYGINIAIYILNIVLSLLWIAT